MDMLSRRDGGEGHLMMQRVRRRDRDDVHRRVADHVSPIVGGAREAKLPGHRVGPICRHVAQRLETDFGDVAHDRRRGAIGQRVRLTHEAGAYETKTQHDVSLPGAEFLFHYRNEVLGCFCQDER